MFNSSAQDTLAWKEQSAASASWMMVTSGGAITLDHVDAEGLATWVQMEKDSKVWLVSMGPAKSADNIFDNDKSWRMDPWQLNDIGFLSTHYNWKTIYLQEGNIL